MRKEKIILALIVLGGLVLRLINLNQSFWLDEAAQVIESSRSFLSQFHIPSDFHPPLYHVLLHFWMYFGNSEVWVRLLPVLLGTGSIILLYRVGTNLGNRKEGLIASLFLALSPYHIWYSQEARPYILFVFLSLLTTYLLLKKKWVMYFLATTLSLYSFYFAQFFILGQLIWIFFFARKDFGKYSKSLFLAILLFIPWLPSFWQQIGRGTSGVFAGWTNVVSVPGLKAIPLTIAKFIFGKGSIDNLFLYSLIVLPVFLVFVISLLEVYKKKEGKIILSLFFIPLTTAVFVSFFIPIAAPQRFIFLLPLFLIILAKGIGRFPKFGKWAAVLIICFTSMMGIIQYYTDPYVQREQWREAVDYVEKQPSEQSIALLVFPAPFAPYLWYSKNVIEAVGIAPKFNLRDEDLSNLAVKLINKKTVYLFQYLTGLTDPQDKTKAFLENNGFTERIIKDFPGVGFIYVYDRK